MTCEEARFIYKDDLPRFMASTPTIIHRKYGKVKVTQADIDSANKEIEKELDKQA